jgi:hypothetical protein
MLIITRSTLPISYFTKLIIIYIYLYIYIMYICKISQPHKIDHSLQKLYKTSIKTNMKYPQNLKQIYIFTMLIDNNITKGLTVNLVFSFKYTLVIDGKRTPLSNSITFQNCVLDIQQILMINDCLVQYKFKSCVYSEIIIIVVINLVLNYALRHNNLINIHFTNR